VFSGYVFLRGSEEDRVQSLRSGRISQTVSVDDQKQLQHDLKQVHHLIGTGAQITLQPRLLPGRTVRVSSGPFRGLEGTVVARRGRKLLLMAVHFLNTGVSVEIDGCQLQPVD